MDCPCCIGRVCSTCRPLQALAGVAREREERTDLQDPGQTPGVRPAAWSAFAATTFYNSFISEISTMSGQSRGPSGPDNNLIKAPKCKEIKNKVSPNN